MKHSARVIPEHLVYLDPTEEVPSDWEFVEQKTMFVYRKPTIVKTVARKSIKAETRKPSSAFMKELQPSPELAEIVGNDPIPRTEVVSRLWRYIQDHKLQNPNNRRNIIADKKLAKVFGRKEVTMFELATIVGRHLSDCPQKEK